ncbi:glycosyltransferase [Leptolyngbya sp. FACHB-17]|uniref:glycosyltransferase n=1 Tax=unclassified Leptolyngbya TaxID=2650499 RepID=UPI001681ABA5|nr:glycosyltransferase [Leptolyngbya sp. FACHB-17]MBD2080253.1 glycosyltransferase [Leptolyngbya sp. FACHB-17]
MKIGYLHIGALQHGIRRYGRLLAAEAQSRSQLQVIEAEVNLTGDRQHDCTSLIHAAQTLAQADVVHFQYNRAIWRDHWSQLSYLDAFLNHCSRPLVVTLHDIFYPPSSATLTQRYFSHPGTVRFSDLAKAVLRDRVAPHILALQKVIARSRVVIVCTQEEAQRLSDRIDRAKLSIIPHFVESRHLQNDRAEARRTLGLEPFTVITLLGFIYSGKGHSLLIRALPKLPETVKVIFAGGVSAGHEAYYQELLSLAEQVGVRDRLRVTGYLPEAELEQYLLSTDLAVCPFRQTSASGSLSTWISVERPILASNIPQVEEYNRLQPHAIATFEPYTSDAIVDALNHLIPSCSPEPDPNVSRLRHHLSMPKIFDQHLSHYQAAYESQSYSSAKIA